MTRRVVISALLAFALLATLAGSATHAAPGAVYNTATAKQVSCKTPGAVSIVMFGAGTTTACYAGVGHVDAPRDFNKISAGKWHVTVYIQADLTVGTVKLNPGESWQPAFPVPDIFGYAFDIAV
ncbi:MAG TPA: hypothetical protein VFB12_11755 [Ktedonobacteraceae bacterium]|nr:hypothetical protein [Ktedonobacteraceae bacterium]